MRLVFVKEVGAYLDADNNVRPIGAKLTISNLRIGGGPTWLNGNNIYLWVEFSNNLYSGVVYCYVQGFDMDVEFFEKGNESKLITFGNEGDNSVFTFASLNGYGNGSLNPTPTKNINRHEFAGLRNNGDGQLVKGSLLKKHSDGKYFADNSTDGHFTDKLASKNFNLAAVSFPLKGTKHEFTMGTTYGRAWNTFASSQVKKVQQKSPTKTVQPLQQYKDGDLWSNPTGEESGFNQRYWNDLDSYDRDGNLLWEFPEAYRQEGHNVEKGNLAVGVPKKENRFVEPGKEHYYFINQETINVYTESILMPESYVISDVLPEGVTIAGDVQEALTLYNLDGSKLSLESSNISYDAQKRKLVVRISSDVATQIHQKGALSEYGGKDFSLRLKVNVVQKDSGNSKSTMTNSAKVTFVYADGTTLEEKETNHVQTRLKEPTIDVELNKTDNSGAALAGAEFGLFVTEESEKAKYATSTTAQNGKLKFKDVLPGSYWLKETKTPAGFKTMTPIKVTINANGIIIGKDITNNQIKNELKPIEISVEKVNQKGEFLTGAKFQLKKKDSQEVFNFSENPAKLGVYILAECQPGTYELIETQAPAGFEKIQGTIGTLKITSSGEITYSLANTVVNKEGNTIKIALPKIVNQMKKFDLNIIKKDAVTTELLDGVEFTLFDSTGKQKIGESQKTTKGEVNFQGLLEPGKTYHLRETTALASYLKLQHDFIIAVAVDGTVKVTHNNNDYEFTAIKEAVGEVNNTLTFTVFNHPRTPLPKTGGTGRYQFSLLSIIAISTTLTFFAYYQSKAKKGGDA